MPPAARAGGRRALVIGLAAVILVVVVAGAYGLWYLFLRPSGPAAVGAPSLGSVSTATPLSASASVSSSAPASSSAANATAKGGSGSSTGVDGTWTVNTSIGSFADFSGSFVGYRVQEQLASVGGNTAVGRTPSVSGSLTISGTTVTAAEITADLTGLKSDDGRRDGQLSRQGLQTSQYPTATFTLSSPIDLGSVPSDGAKVTVNATGQLTLHGQTRDVTITLTAVWSGDTIEVTGSTEITFADYGIQKPSSFAVLSIADTGTLELQLFFTRS